jgi:RNA polymerase sigma-70 factor (ECF subfamily)
MSSTRISLIERVANPDDQEAWSEFFSIYEPVLISYVRSHSQCRGMGGADVDDLVQTVLIKLFRKLPEFNLDRSRGRFRTYLYQVTSNAIIDHLRSRRRQPRTPGEIPEPPPERPDNGWDETYRAALLNRAAAEVKEQVYPRNPNQWTSFEEQCLKGRPAKEVASELGISVDSVYQNSSRLMKRVQELCRIRYQEDFADDA